MAKLADARDLKTIQVLCTILHHNALSCRTSVLMRVTADLVLHRFAHGRTHLQTQLAPKLTPEPPVQGMVGCVATQLNGVGGLDVFSDFEPCSQLFDQKKLRGRFCTRLKVQFDHFCDNDEEGELSLYAAVGLPASAMHRVLFDASHQSLAAA